MKVKPGSMGRGLLSVALMGIALLGAVGSATESTTYCIRRAALVPAPTPSLRPARQSQGYVEANVSAETVAYAKPARKLEGANVGLYVPRQQLSGQLLFSPHRIFTVGASFEAGLADGAIPISPGLVDPPTRSIGGGGVHLALHFKLSHQVTLGLSCDGWGYQIASRIAFMPASSCAGLPDQSTWPNKPASTFIFIGRIQLATGIDFDWSHLTFGVGLRNHPYNEGQSVETHTSPSDIEPLISQTIYPYVYVGWEVRLYRGLFFGATVYQPLKFEPVIYAPIFGLNLRLTHLARERNEWKGEPPEPEPIRQYPY